MKRSTIALATAISAIAGCASTLPTAQLQSARSSYFAAKSQPNSGYALDSLDDAQKALATAENAHIRDPGSYEEASLAYVAGRRAELAMTKANAAAARATTEQAEQEYVRRQGVMLDASRDSQAATQNALHDTSAQLSSEHAARLKAEQQARTAMESLKEIAIVKEESRGTVITLDGSVLFVSGQAELMSVAKARLDKVAASILDVGGNEKVRVLGYTDSRGNDATNQELSRRRAQAVADQLISHGIATARIEVQGMGEAEPVASNETAEGRANNRRVEIVLAPHGTPDATVGTR